MIQALQFAMTSSTTQIRPHFSKSMDISTLEDSQVLSAFPYDIRFLDLSPEDANDFGLNPLLPVQSSLGIHATVMDSADRAGLDPLDFGKGGKSRRESSKGKGKKGKGKGKGKAHTNAPFTKEGKMIGMTGAIGVMTRLTAPGRKTGTTTDGLQTIAPHKVKATSLPPPNGTRVSSAALMLRWSAVCVLPATGSWGLT